MCSRLVAKVPKQAVLLELFRIEQFEVRTRMSFCSKQSHPVGLDSSPWKQETYVLSTHRYLIFFSPFDICYGLCHFLPVNLILWIIKELVRAKKVYSGVKMAANVYPNSLLAMAIVGMFKGTNIKQP